MFLAHSSVAVAFSFARNVKSLRMEVSKVRWPVLSSLTRAVDIDDGITGNSSDGIKAEAVLFKEAKVLPGTNDSRKARGFASTRRAFKGVSVKVDWVGTASDISISGN